MQVFGFPVLNKNRMIRTGLEKMQPAKFPSRFPSGAFDRLEYIFTSGVMAA